MPSPLKLRTCAWCKSLWETRSVKARTCSPKCRAQLREKEHGATRGSEPRIYPADLVQRVRELYEAGMTIREVQKEIGHGVKVQNVMFRHSIPTRVAAKRDQRGEKNANWLGDDAAYSALHRRVESERGKPQKCSACDTEDQALRYDWANLTGEYQNLNDYVRLCTSCHSAVDNRMRKRIGGQLSEHVRKGGDANVR